MRPLMLTMRAFGPYGGTQVIDFRELGDRRLFLIHGATGGGKSTLLDAMCFALYGEVSAGSKERHPDTLRSHHADEDTETEVSFEFAVGEARYCVTRCPRQERLKKRGDGVTVVQPRVALTSLGPDGQVTKVLGTKTREVDEEVERILGFRADQFRQVIVLPQGQFRELLTSTSEERENILEMLFETTHYKKMQMRLKDRQLDLKRALERLQDQRGTLLDQTQVTSVEELEATIRRADQEITELDPDIARARVNEESARAAQKAAQESLTKLDSVTRREMETQRLEAQAPEIEVVRQRVQAAQKAARIETDFAWFESAAKALDDAQREWATAREQLVSAESASKIAAEHLVRAKECESVRKELEQELGRVDELRKAVPALLNARKELRRAQQAVVGTESQIKTFEGALEQLKAQLAGGESRADHLDEVLRTTEGVQLLLNEAVRRRDQRRKLAEAQASVEVAKRTIAEADLRAKEDMVRRDEIARERDRLVALNTEGNAARLAQQLAEGVACPVCGSTEHPAPATGMTDLPTDDLLKAAQEAVQGAERKAQAAREALASAKQVLVGAESRYRELSSELGDHASSSMGELIESVANLEIKARARSTAQQERQQITVSVKELREKTEATKLELESRRATLAEAQGELTAATTRVQERQEAIPPDYREVDDLAAHAEALRRRVTLLQKEFDEAQSAQSRAGEAEAEARGRAQAARKDLDIRQIEHRSKADQWVSKRQDAGFVTDEDHRRAQLEAAEIKRLEDRIMDFERRSNEAKALLSQARVDAVGLVRPDISMLDAALVEATGRRAGVEERRARLDEQRGGMQRTLGTIQELTAACADREREYGIVGRLAEVANGKNVRNLTFQRFVLAAFLDEVLLAASERLRRMSRGRYQLERAQGPRDGRTQSGLDLEVHDAYCGRSRPVATLSGGESFQAALSLALGLSDVVQAHSGGVRLDTMFIDEGFGSLDPEALDLAINTLIDLQESGRLVGVISHVAEMKERIDVQLRVEAGREGSSARFVVA